MPNQKSQFRITNLKVLQLTWSENDPQKPTNQKDTAAASVL